MLAKHLVVQQCQSFRGNQSDLSFASSTRVVSGTPTLAATHAVIYSVTDADSRTERRSFSIRVMASSTAPAKAKAPAPTGLAATTLVAATLDSPGSARLTWNAVTNAHRYRLEIATSTSVDWSVAADDLTTTSHTVPGFECAITYRFRVSARGDGDHYSVEWGAPSSTLSHAAGSCNRPPEFATSSYAFSVAEDTPKWNVVGHISATDPDSGDFVSFRITAGNTGGKFVVSTAIQGGKGTSSCGARWTTRPGLRTL